MQQIVVFSQRESKFSILMQSTTNLQQIETSLNKPLNGTLPSYMIVFPKPKPKAKLFLG